MIKSVNEWMHDLEQLTTREQAEVILERACRGNFTADMDAMTFALAALKKLAVEESRFEFEEPTQ